MSFFRSDDMEYFRVIMPRDSAWETMNSLGKFNLVHVVPNRNINMARPFIAQVKRCEQSLAKIKNIEKVIEEKNFGKRREFITEDDLKSLDHMWEVHEKTGGNQETRFTAVEEEINKINKYQQDLVVRKADIKDKLLFLRENIAIVKAGEKQYGQSFFEIKTNFFENPDHASIFGLHELQIKAIVAEGKGVASVKRTINRITRGNCFISEVHYKDIFQNLYPGEQNKSVLFFIYPAKKDSLLDKKVVKVIDNYCKNWNKYILPQTDSDFRTKISNIQQNYSDAQKMFQFTQDEDRKFLLGLLDHVEGKNITLLEYYKFYLLKQKQIYSQLNEMTTHANFLDGEVFIRKQDVEQTMQLMHKVGMQSHAPVGRLQKQQNSRMPSHFQLNDFKMPAQQITNTYGVPKYKQANPSFFGLVTFPFLFGVMFGDMGHGSILFLLGIILLFQSHTSTNFVIRALYPYRYLLTLMGFFATYCGFIYNDFISISMNFFGSCFNIKDAKPQQQIHRISPDCVYPFGLDPVWGIASNNLNYINSLKMKISVIIAVVHMTVGVFVKAANSIYFKKKLQFIFQFLPQIVFMVALFGYMDFLIIYKWLKPWKLYDSEAPSIITTMINLPLKVGKTDKCCGGQPMWGSVGSTSQDGIQFILLVLGVICIPLMLLPKPIIQICGMKKKNKGETHRMPEQVSVDGEIIGEDVSLRNNAQQQGQYQEQRGSVSGPGTNAYKQINQQVVDSSGQKGPGYKVSNQQNATNPGTSTSASQVQSKDKQHQEDASQIFVHQLIQTIEYVLGCISNTASYLRLWALSLAHSQLSEVFFQKTVETGLAKGMTGIPILILAFPILAFATFGVLLCMDSMECFLHTLRLHWVEFQNKFYKGDGFLFTPVSFKQMIRENVAKMA